MKKVTIWTGRKDEVMYIDDNSFRKMDKTNVKCVEAMLKTVGFKKTQVVSLKKHRGFPSPNTGRVVIHGWK